jgi:hypothetical protein
LLVDDSEPLDVDVDAADLSDFVSDFVSVLVSVLVSDLPFAELDAFASARLSVR